MEHEVIHETIKLDDIKMENPYLRLGTDVETLEKSIQTVGLISPLIVNQNNVLLAGARRWQALKNLGFDDVQVIRVEKDSLHQELISIDENLVRKSLSTPEMEKQLLRTKEIYRDLADQDEDFKKQLMDKYNMFKSLEEEEVSQENPRKKNEEPIDENDIDQVTSVVFAKEVSEKSGMSENQIKKAMEREQKSSPIIKEARNRGELSVSQTNELIRLKEDEQEALIEHVSDRTVSELRKLVKDVKAQGVDEALRLNEKAPHAREFNELLKLLKKARKITETLSYEHVELSGPIRKDMEKFWDELQGHMNKIMGLSTGASLMGNEGEGEDPYHPEYMNSSPDHSSTETINQ
ncbi:MAG: hypothetical protein CME63_01820 [Halobacteriovoraceae bacterium]|nr:hypothetical protein [Halobacteriovoraceae bacterium]|tara:strand:+ start:30684 stop:31733 length:1050 start_codon:yes stop_codon:yes gene_type:complete